MKENFGLYCTGSATRFLLKMISSNPECWLADVCIKCILNSSGSFHLVCNRPNGNLADLQSTKLQFSQFWKKKNTYNYHVNHWITIPLTYPNLSNGNLVVNTEIVNIYLFPKSTKLSFSWLQKRNLRYVRHTAQKNFDTWGSPLNRGRTHCS